MLIDLSCARIRGRRKIEEEEEEEEEEEIKLCKVGKLTPGERRNSKSARANELYSWVVLPSKVWVSHK
jgi:hypothetical protein